MKMKINRKKFKKMKRILLIILIGFLSQATFAQKPSNWSTATKNAVKTALGLDTEYVKVVDAIDADWDSINHRLVITESDSIWYINADGGEAIQAPFDELAPTNLIVTSNIGTSLSFEWDINSTDASGSIIYQSTDNSTFTPIDTTTGNIATVTGLTAGDLYYFKVANYNTSTVTDYSNTYNTAFIITINTENPGVSASDSVILPVNSGFGDDVDYDIDWGDGSSENVSQGFASDIGHTYAIAGEYQITITGTLWRLSYDNTDDKQKIISIDNWGTMAWNSMKTAYEGCDSLTVAATDIPNLSGVTDMNSAFYGEATITGNLNWDVSSVADFSRALSNATAVHNFGTWDISSATTLYMFNSSGDMNETGTTDNYDNTLIAWDVLDVTITTSPNFGVAKYDEGAVDNGTTDGITASKLVESGQDFTTTVSVGDVIHNTTDDTFARVTAVDSDTQLSLDTDIIVSGENYIVQGSDAAKARASLTLDNTWSISDGGAF